MRSNPPPSKRHIGNPVSLSDGNNFLSILKSFFHLCRRTVNYNNLRLGSFGCSKNGKTLDEPAFCKMLKIESFEQMNYGQLKWFNDMMEKNGL